MKKNDIVFVIGNKIKRSDGFINWTIEMDKFIGKVYKIDGLEGNYILLNNCRNSCNMYFAFLKEWLVKI